MDRPFVLSIAGFDPSGGAGVLADCKTFENIGVQGMAVLTANTIQTEDKFSHMDWMPIIIVQQGIRTLMSRYSIEVVKIGIVPNVAFLSAVLESVFACNPKAEVVWDPVLKSSTGYAFFSDQEITLLSDVLKSLTLITPNFNEYQILSQFFKVEDGCAVLLKGGHRLERLGVDSLLWNEKVIDFEPEIKRVYPKHGSGCVLSAAISAYLAKGLELTSACQQAKVFTERFLNSHFSLLGSYERTT